MTKICDERPVECGDPACPCHEWSAKSPSESSESGNQPTGFLVSEPENSLEREYAQASPIPASGAPTGCACDPDVNYWCDFHGQERAEYMAGYRPTPSATIPAAPDFDHEWREAPESRRRYTERSEAEWWLMRGVWIGIQYERERGLLAMNQDLREMQRIARERINATT